MKLDPSAFLANPELLQALRKGSIELSCGGEYYLFRQGELPVGLFIVNSGAVTLSMSSPIGEQILRMQVGVGSLLGLPGLIGNEPYTLTAMACEGACLSFVDPESFKRLMQTEPGLAIKVLEVLAAEVRAARRATQDLRPLATGENNRETIHHNSNSISKLN